MPMQHQPAAQARRKRLPCLRCGLVLLCMVRLPVPAPPGSSRSRFALLSMPAALGGHAAAATPTCPRKAVDMAPRSLLRVLDYCFDVSDEILRLQVVADCAFATPVDAYQQTIFS